jgi:DNA polymerase-3 subunit epsilon
LGINKNCEGLNVREIVLDTETTGLNLLEGHRIIEIGCVELINKVKTGKSFHTYLNPGREVSPDAYNVHGKSTDFLKDKPIFADKAREFLEFIGPSLLIIHNAAFDIKFLNYELGLLNIASIRMERVQDTLIMARKRYPGSPANLDALCRRFNIDLSERSKHSALLDAKLLADVYIELCGGIQASLDFESNHKMQQEQLKVLAREALGIKIVKESRDFPVPQEDINLHQEFISQIKDALWLKIESE